MKKIIYSAISAVFIFICASCSNYLDIVPDNIPSVQQVFDTRANAFKMLYTCYDYMPRVANVFQNPALLCGDENWNPEFVDPNFYYYRNKSTVYIAKGELNKTDPLLNYWDGGDYSNLDQKLEMWTRKQKLKVYGQE